MLPLSSSSLRLILEYVNLDTRLRIRHCIPEVQIVESETLTYLKNVLIEKPKPHDPQKIKINGRQWTFHQTLEGGNSTKVEFSYPRNDINKDYQVKLSPGKAAKKLALRYLTNNSRIGCIRLDTFPNWFDHLDSSFKLFIKELDIVKPEKDSSLNFLEFINESSLEKVSIPMNRDMMQFWKEPVIFNVKELHLTFCHEKPVNKKEVILQLRNEIVTLSNLNGPIDYFEELITIWKSPGRPIGSGIRITTGSEREFIDALQVAFHKFKEGHVASLPELGNGDWAQTFTIPIDKRSDFVIYAEDLTEFYSKKTFLLTMEIMRKGRAVFDYLEC